MAGMNWIKASTCQNFFNHYFILLCPSEVRKNEGGLCPSEVRKNEGGPKNPEGENYVFPTGQAASHKNKILYGVHPVKYWSEQFNRVNSVKFAVQLFNRVNLLGDFLQKSKISKISCGKAQVEMKESL